MRGSVDKTGPAGHQKDQQKLDRLRAGVILRAYVQEWPAIDLGAVTVETGAESWASFLESAGVDELAVALAELNNNAARGLP
jgi:hypothetical protein